MKRHHFFLYILVLSIPFFLGLVVWQSNRYQNLENELKRLEQTQAEWVESNKRLIAGITEYSSPKRIEDIAVNQLSLIKIKPESLLQVRITEGKE
ncbi:MAG: cell division protein FtsL [Treponema sp.]|jgi:cell division protein FtsL|nr:cell division protein FtsL [Treponema sp.]